MKSDNAANLNLNFLFFFHARKKNASAMAGLGAPVKVSPLIRVTIGPTLSTRVCFFNLVKVQLWLSSYSLSCGLFEESIIIARVMTIPRWVSQNLKQNYNFLFFYPLMSAFSTYQNRI